eukprot:SM000019S05105  [mRNA]  locus=s19:914330:914997:- [translate_table: standard]
MSSLAIWRSTRGIGPTNFGLQYQRTLGQIHFWFFGSYAFLGTCSFGSHVSVVDISLFLYIVYLILSNDHKCAASPWATQDDSTTLEWMVQSPPAFHTFEEIPAIKETLECIFDLCNCCMYDAQQMLDAVFQNIATPRLRCRVYFKNACKCC